MDSKYEIYNIDCLEKMKEYPDKYFDLVLTDPPYGVNFPYSMYEDTEENWYALMEQAIPEMIRIGKITIFTAGRVKRMEWYYKNYPPKWIICWYKGNPSIHSPIGFNDWEPVLFYGNNKGLCMHDYLCVPPQHINKLEGHPCPKPVKWAKWFIERTTKEGDTVFDPFMGSGTTGAACMQLRRKFVGCEIDPNYFAGCERRLKEETAQIEIDEL